MSILMTANSKKTRAGKKKAKTSHAAARVPYLAEGSTPPYSDETTSVWFWVLDGNPTTVTYCKSKNEVRCNGFILEAYDGFVEGDGDDLDGADGDDDDDYDAGGVTDFAIFVAESQTSHDGRLVRLHPSGSVGLRTHDLYVDGFLIPEHIEGANSSQGPYSDGFNDDAGLLMQGGSRHFEYAAGSGPDQHRYDDEPPNYGSAMYGEQMEPCAPW